MKERPIIFSVTTGQPSKKGQRLRSVDGLTWAQRNRAFQKMALSWPAPPPGTISTDRVEPPEP